MSKNTASQKPKTFEEIVAQDREVMGDESEYNGKIIFHDKKSILGSTIGRVSNVVSAVLFADPHRIMNRFTQQKKADIQRKIEERFKNVHFRDDLHIYLGGSGYRDRYKELVREKKVSDGLGNRLKASLMNIGVNTFRADSYAPGLNTMSLFDDRYSTAAHEMGHALIRNSREGLRLALGASEDFLPSTTKKEERLASNFAMRFMTDDERKKASGDLSGAYGTYQGGKIGLALSLPSWVLGVLTANPLLTWGGFVLPTIGAGVGAYGQRIRNLFRRNKANKNTFIKRDPQKGIDTNPYWDGMVSEEKKEE